MPQEEPLPHELTQALRQQRLLQLIKEGIQTEVAELSSRGHLLVELKQDQTYLLRAGEQFVEQTAPSGLYTEDDASQVADLYIRELVAAIEQDLKNSPVVMGGQSSEKPPFGPVRPSMMSAPSASLEDVDHPMLDRRTASTQDTSEDDFMESGTTSSTNNQGDSLTSHGSEPLQSQSRASPKPRGNNNQPIVASSTSAPQRSLMSFGESVPSQPVASPGNNNRHILAPLQPLAVLADVDQSMSDVSSSSTPSNGSGAASVHAQKSQVPLRFNTAQSGTSRHCPSCGGNQGMQSPNPLSTPDNCNDSSDSENLLRSRGKKRPKEVNAFNVRTEYL